jgi:hypothetical protein
MREMALKKMKRKRRELAASLGCRLSQRGLDDG